MNRLSQLKPRKNHMNTTINTFGDEASNLAHEAALSTEQAIRSTQHLAQQGLDGLGSARAQTGAALQQLREKSLHARQATAEYIQHEPIKSALIAAAVGAGLMGLLALFSRHRGNGH
jgi:ElaB/YqjD/DUF883 family membrane-anchored ribosome-binding protein